MENLNERNELNPLQINGTRSLIGIFHNDLLIRTRKIFQFNKIHLLFENKNKNKSHC